MAPTSLDAQAAADACKDLARARVASAADDPEARYALRAAFYEKYGFHKGPPGYGASELAFLRWEIDRGGLAPSGSPWWRAVNASFLEASQEAALLFERLSPEERAALSPSPAVRAWLEYLDDPGPVTWYRAHNTSIALGYLAAEALARAEPRDEQVFITMVLYRVLFAQHMVKADEGAHGWLHELVASAEREAALPDLPAVRLLVHLHAFYPPKYPVTRADFPAMLGHGASPEELGIRLLDDALILPRAEAIYAEAARTLGVPELMTLLVNGQPRYPRRSETAPAND